MYTDLVLAGLTFWVLYGGLYGLGRLVDQKAPFIFYVTSFIIAAVFWPIIKGIDDVTKNS